MVGLIVVPLLTIIDPTSLIVHPGIWLKTHHGPDLVIILIFLLSGMALNTSQLKEGLADVQGTLLALTLIFIIAPLVGFVFAQLPLQPGIIIGLLLVAAMPTTLSSGVVMTGSAGGNMAHALLITIIANALAVITIPVTLTLLFGDGGNRGEIEIDQLAIMLKLITRVLLPLFLGIYLRNCWSTLVTPLLPCTTPANQFCILGMVWMAVCGGKGAILSELSSIFLVLLVVFLYHLLLLFAGLGLTMAAGVKKGKRESIIFMGAQKTLPLSVIIQVSLFPEHGIALVVCVLHHIVHLVMDAYLINPLKNRSQ